MFYFLIQQINNFQTITFILNKYFKLIEQQLITSTYQIPIKEKDLSIDQSTLNKMFMHRQLKQGKLFQLGKVKPQQQENTQNNTFNKLSSEQELKNQQIQYQPPKFTNFQDMNVQQLAMNNNAIVICCGMFMCLLCTSIAIGLFYYFIFDHLKPYLPFLSPAEQSLAFLTENNAKSYFQLNPMYAGQIHYARVPVQYWGHRIDMIKSMGLNTLSVNVFWNYHEIAKGNFDFQNKNKNLTHFLQLCKEKNMKVLLKPGPYLQANWDFGGLPARLLTIKGLQIRSSNELFIQETRKYFQALSKVIRKYILNEKNPNGTISMIQIQHQPSEYTQQVLYITKLKQIWNDIGIDCPLYFSDTANGLSTTPLYWENAIIGMNSNLYNSSDFDRIDSSGHFVFSSQTHSGWSTSWGVQNKEESDMAVKYVGNFYKQVSDMLGDKRSFSISMPHGGTNFGLTAAYNYTTSYDYFAPISEQGKPSQNYYIFRSVFANFTQKSLIQVPVSSKAISVTFGALNQISSLFDNLPKAILDSNQKEPLVFESQQLQMYNQGLVLYETSLSGPKSYTFEVIMHDIAFVYVNGQYIQTIVRKKGSVQEEITQLKVECQSEICQLQILVEAMGHLSFGNQMKNDKKGICKFVEKNATVPLELTWKHYAFDVTEEPKWGNKQKCTKAPCLYQVQVELTQISDTFINVEGLKKGYIWVNGYNLGRYWNIGPQHSLYCPGAWFNKGRNKILVLDLYQANVSKILKGQKKMNSDLIF